MPKLSEAEKETLKQKLPDYLASKGIALQANKPIKCINPAHDDNKPSMSYKAQDNFLFCFSCGASYDIFAACEVLEGLAAGQGINRIKQIYGYGQNQDTTRPQQQVITNNQLATIHGQPEPVQAKTAQPVKDYTDEINQAHSRLSMNDYHIKRGITETTATRFKLGYTTHKGQAFLVIPMQRPDNTYTYQYRNTDPSAALQHYKPAKEEAGEAVIFNSQIIGHTDKPIFITEGAIDALSIIEAGGEAIGLNGATNHEKLYSLIAQHKQRIKQPLVLSLDNDEAGRTAQAKIKQGLKQVGVAAYEVNVSQNTKDPNEALIAHREPFIALIRYLDRESSIRRKEYNQRTVERDIGGFLDYITAKRPAAISTGFKMLDKVLRGGLREGLICLGGISSLGKTTLALQMMDNIAKQGKDVLIFSLEMGSYELRAKSIARESLSLSMQQTGFSLNALTTLEILDREIRSSLPKQNQEILKDAFSEYKKYGKNVFIHEAVGKFTVNDIKDKVEDHIRATGNAPVVLVDYLQILQPAETGLSDKGKVSYDVLMLKQLSRDKHIPVVVVSSFNRDSYDKEASFSSFKESGEIEYSADVLIALQLTAVRTGEDIQEALQETPRRVDVKLLKNRNGTLDIVSFNATLANNYLEEMDGRDIENIKKKVKAKKEAPAGKARNY